MDDTMAGERFRPEGHRMLLPIIEVSRERIAAAGADAEAALLARVERLGRTGEVVLVDVDAATGTGDNEALIRRAIRVASCFVGGGIRDEDKVRRLLRAGARRVVLGTAVTPDFLSRLPRYRVLASLDAVDGMVVTDGRTRATSRTPVAAIQVLAPYCSGFVCSFVDADGAGAPPAAGQVRELAAASSLYLAVRGAVTCGLAQVRELDRAGVDCAVNLAQDAPGIDPAEAFVACMDFTAGALPTVVQDPQGQVLMLGWSDADTLRRSLDDGVAAFVPGDHDPDDDLPPSRLLRAMPDRSRRALVFTVRPAGSPFDRARYSRFGKGAREFGLSGLFEVIRARRDDPRPGSYTSFLFEKDDRIPRKLTEEIYELLTARTREDITWEAADVVYFLLAYLVKRDVSLDEVLSELMGRER
jgi:phosphoribosyl-ATP pyrophosphohydrolase